MEPVETKHYKIGDKCKTGQEIDCILGQNETFVVFTTKDNHLRWEHTDKNEGIPNEHLGAILQFNNLMAGIAASVPKLYRHVAYTQLGKSLFSALNCPDTINPLTCFTNVENYIKAKAEERARLFYVLASMAALLLLALVFLLTYSYIKAASPDIALIELGGLCGAIGAIISVLQRNSTLEVNPFNGVGYLAFQGIARIILGVIFGCFFVIASKANFILGIFNDDPFPLFTLSVVAGFSERFVPELLGRFEAVHLKESE